MKKAFVFYIFMIIFLCNSPILANTPWQQFKENYTNDKLFIHAISNYEINPLWDLEWEINLIHKNAIRLNFGSVTSSELLCDVKMVINQDLGNGWWFSNFSKWYATQHKDMEEKENFMGLERIVIKNFSFFLYTNPAFNKEEIDIQSGITITDAGRENYFRIALFRDDFIYDKKNDKGGESEKYPTGIKWLLRYGKNRISFFSEGKYSTGFFRRYKNTELSPDINLHKQQVNDLSFKLNYNLTIQSTIEFRFMHYHFFEEKGYYIQESDYSYFNQINNHTFRYLYNFKDRDRIRLGAHYVVQNARLRKSENFNYKRREFIPSIFFELYHKKTMWEFGYMGSIYFWDYDDKSLEDDDYFEDDYIDKAKVGLTYNFNKNSKLQISVSHIISLFGFGGGNLQYLIFF